METIVEGTEKLLTLEEVAALAGLDLPALRYYIYQKKVLQPTRKDGTILLFSQETADQFVSWYKKSKLSITKVADQLAAQHTQKTRAEWLNWLRARIYNSKKLPKPTDTKEFWTRLKRQVTYELKHYAPIVLDAPQTAPEAPEQEQGIEGM